MEKYLKNVQLIPPNYSSDYWNNIKLTNKLKKVINYNLTLITAPVGTGKTTAVLNYLNKENIENYCWYSIKDKEVEVHDFFNLMMESFIQKQIHLKKEKDILYNNWENENLKFDKFIYKLISLFMKTNNKKTFFIIDDFFGLKNQKKIVKCLEKFINKLPSNIHIIIISHEVLEFKNIDLWEIEDKVLYINENDLLLNKKQIKKFSFKKYDLNIVENSLEKIYRETNGWFPAVDLFINYLKNGYKLSNILENKNKYYKTIFKYLDQKFWNSQLKDNDEIKKLLVKTSILKELNYGFCVKFIGEKNAEILFNFLKNNKIFQKDEKDKVYRHSPFLKYFLEEKAKKRGIINELHNNAIKIYSRLGKTDYILYHYINTGNIEKALKVLKQFETKLYCSVEIYELLEDILYLIPNKYYKDYPLLYLFKGDLYLIEKDYEKAFKYYLLAEKYIDESNLNNYIIFLIKITKLHFSILSKSGIIYLNKLLNYNKHFTENQKEQVEFLKSFSDLFKHKFRGTELIKKNIKTINEREFKNFNNYLFINFSELIFSLFLYLIKGEVHIVLEKLWVLNINKNFILRWFVSISKITAEQLIGIDDLKNHRSKYNSLLEENKLLDYGVNHKNYIMIYVIFIEIYYGFLEESIEHSKNLLKFINDEFKLEKAMVYLGLGMSYFFQGDLDLAKEKFEKAFFNFKENDNSLYIFITNVWLTLCFLKKDDKEKFKTKAKTTLKMSKKNNYDFLFLKPTFFGFRNYNYFIQIIIEAKKREIDDKYCNYLLSELEIKELKYPKYNLKIITLGDFKVYRNKKEIKDSMWQRKSSKKLLKLFVANYEKMLSKNEIIKKLWSKKGEEKANNIFNVSLNNLKNLLEPERNGKKSSFINKENNKYGLNNVFIKNDLDLFNKIYKKGVKAKKINIKKGYYELALKIYKGDFLSGYYDEWIVIKRRKIKSKFLNISRELLKIYYDNENHSKCLSFADKILKVDDCCEKAYYYKMKSYIRTGNKVNAAKTYHLYKKVLNEKLDIQPSKKIEDIFNIL